MAVKDFDLVDIADGDVPCFGEFSATEGDWLAKVGTMLNVRAVSRALCSILATVVAGVRWPLARTNFLMIFAPLG